LHTVKKIDPRMVKNARARHELIRLESFKQMSSRPETKFEFNQFTSSKRDFPARFIYFLLDGQDFDQVDNFHFSFLEVNEKLCKLVPQKTWDSPACQRLLFTQKIELASPPEILLRQINLELLQEC
jgi:hypothetical protein